MDTPWPARVPLTHVTGHCLAGERILRWASNRTDIKACFAPDAGLRACHNGSVLFFLPCIHGADTDADGVFARHADNGNIEILILKPEYFDSGKFRVSHAVVLHCAGLGAFMTCITFFGINL